MDFSTLLGLQQIGHDAFSGSSCVPAALKLPNSLEGIGSSAFSNTGVISVDFSNTALGYIGSMLSLIVRLAAIYHFLLL